MQTIQPRFQIGDRVRVRAHWPGLRHRDGRIVGIDRMVGVRYQVQLADGARYVYVSVMLEPIDRTTSCSGPAIVAGSPAVSAIRVIRVREFWLSGRYMHRRLHEGKSYQFTTTARRTMRPCRMLPGCL